MEGPILTPDETADEAWDNLSESEKDDLRYFQKLMYRGLGLDEDGAKKSEDSKLD